MRRALFLLIAFLVPALTFAHNQQVEDEINISSANADFIVEYASNLSELDSWSDNSKFQWKAVDHGVIDNDAEMKRLIEVVKSAAPKDTVGFYKQFFDARDNQYIVLRVDQAKAQRLFHVRVTSIASTTDPTLNTSKTFSTRDYIYISPVRGELQLEIKVWPYGQGEELAKTITFYGHSYGSRGARSVMLDRSRLVPGKYDLQYVKVDDETAKTDTVTISDLQPGKLYTFYDYLLTPIAEAWLRFDGFKRMRIDVDKWAEDIVTHFDDKNIGVMTGRQMPFLKHKWLEAPNPSYLDTRMFAPHDTLWLSVFRDGKEMAEDKDLVMNVTLINSDRTAKDNKPMPWGYKNGHYYAVNNGEPCVIEAYIKGYAPKVTFFRGAFDPKTGWLYPEEGETNIYLETTRMPDSGVLVSNMEITSLEYVDGMRNEYSLANIAQIDLLNSPITSIVNYDEYGSQKDKKKYVDGEIYDRLAELRVTFTAKNDKMPGDRLYLRKDNSAEENKIKVEKLEGDASKLYYPSFDYSYWDAKFSLLDYLDPNDTGRPYLAIDDNAVQKLPILHNLYLNIEAYKKAVEDETKKSIQPDEEAEKKGTDSLNDLPSFQSLNISFKFPMAPPPLYVRFGVDADMVRTKKLCLFGAIGIGIDFDFLDSDGATNKWKEGYRGLGPNKRLADFNPNKINIRSTDENNVVQESKWEDIVGKFTDDNNDMFTAKASAFLEAFSQFSIPIPLYWEAHDHIGMRLIDEININGKVSLNLGAKFSLLDFAGWAARKTGYGEGAVDWLQSNKYTKAIFKALDSGLEFNFNTFVSAKAGIYYYDDGTKERNPLKNHLIGTSFQARVDLAMRLGLKLDVILAGVEGGVLGAAGAYIKGSVGDRLAFDRPFNGVAWSYRAGFGLYYRVHALFWSKRGEKMFGGIDYKPDMLIGNQTSSNPFHKDYKSYMATGEKKKAPARVRRLPGDVVTSGIDLNYPIRFLSGGDSIIYKSDADSPNNRHLRVVSTGNPTIVSDYLTGGAANFHSASSPNMDIAVFEQASRKLTDSEIAPSEDQLADCVARNGDISKIYYSMKKAGGKWIRAKLVSNDRDTNMKPRVALDDNGNAAAIWQQGYLSRNYRLTSEEQKDVANLLFIGNLVLSRFNGSSWTEPVELLRLNRNLRLSEYQLTVRDGEVFIAATEILPDDVVKPVFIHVSADNTVTFSDAPMELNNKFELRRVGSHNVLAQLAEVGSGENMQVRVALNSYDMQGQADGEVSTSVTAQNADISSFRLVADQNARSLSNLGLMWMQSSQETASNNTCNVLKAARLVPDGKNMHVGTPLILAQIDDESQVYDFDGYMTDEKISGCYLVSDASAGTQINRVTAYFQNAFSYTIQFDQEENQAISSSGEQGKQTNFVVKVSNLGTSTINNCVLNVEGLNDPIPLHLIVPAGVTCQERVSIPYKSGKTINTTLTVTYDDVLGLQKKQLPRFLARREKRAFARRNGMKYSDEYSSEDAIYEQKTARLFPDIPQLECYPVSQTVDENGNNHFIVHLKNNSVRPMPDDYSIIIFVGDEKETLPKSVKNTSWDKATGMVFSQFSVLRVTPDNPFWKGCGQFYPRNGYETADFDVEVPNVTETKTMFMRVVVYNTADIWNTEEFMLPLTGGDKGHEYSIITVYPSNETTSVKNVYDEGDNNASLKVSVSGSQVEVTGANPGEDVRLYFANGMILARQKASAEGKAVFSMSRFRNGVYLLSNNNETVKFKF